MRLTKGILVRLINASLSFVAGTTFAAVTGQWDFKSGNLNATVGQAMQYLNSETQTGTQFGTTTTLGIPNIAGQSTNVMKFPKVSDELGGYNAPAGAVGNGGGSFVNQYSIIMDVLFPTNSSGKIRALIVTDSGGEFFANASDALSFSGGSFGGSLTPNAWHRIAYTVDTSTTISMFVDGIKVDEEPTPGGLDGPFAVISGINLFDDANTNSQIGYVASIQFQDQKLSDGFINGLGAPTPGGIRTGPPPNPYVVSEAPTSDLRFPARSTVPPNPLLKVILADGVTTVSSGTVQLKLNGSVVPASVVYSAPTTTISYQLTTFLPSGSSNFVSLTYQDSSANNLGAQYAFYVGPYIALPTNAIVASANTPGFIYRVAQAPITASLGSSLTRALQQLDGTLLDTNGLPFGNEADLTQQGSQPDGSYFLDVYEANDGSVAFDYQGGLFYQLPNLNTYAFPGIPGTNGSTDNFADDVLTYLQLSAGSYVFGVDVGIGRVDDPPGADDGYMLFCGQNPRDAFSTVVGQFQRTGSNFGDHQNTNQFTFVAPVSGIYPFRLVHWQTHQSADLGWYYIDSSGNQLLINDPSGPIKAYRVSATPREPYVAEVYPVPGGAGFPASAPIEVILSDDTRSVGPNTIKLFLNGTQVSLNSSNKVGKLTTILHNPNANRTTVTNTVQLVYGDNVGNFFTNNWSFTIIVGGANVAPITGQWDFDNCDLTASIGKDLKYLDGPSGTTASQTHFGTCSSFGIPTINGFDATVMKVPGGAGVQGNNNFGYIMDHQIGPNGGGTRVNQYTIIWDMYYTGGTLPFFNCENTNNATDGSLFLQGGQMGQGAGGYNMPGLPGNAMTAGWHRLAFAVDLAQNFITKWVDGVKAQDWVSGANALDAARRSWQPTVVLFADGDGDDHDATIYVNSIQVRNGKMTDAQMAALGGPSGQGVPEQVPATSVTGQWDFNVGNLMATIGKDLQYFDGAGTTSNLTAFGTCSSFAIPLINGVDANVMKVPGGAGVQGNNNFGYVMNHQISPNGGGTKVNQYTIIWDMYYTGGTLPFFNCENTNNTAGTDGSLFLQNGQMGQGGGGYNMPGLPGNAMTAGWHRMAFAVDLSQNLITKWVDGIKAQDWISGANALDAARRAWQPTVNLFSDADNDDHDATVYVKSIQVSSGKMTDAQMVALGAPDGRAIPAAAPASSVSGQWDFNLGNLMATVGKDLQYLDGAGTTSNLTTYGTCSSFGIPLINGVDAKIMKVPGGAGVQGNNNFGYIMDHQIGPNGGGTRVNQYTIIWDMYYTGGTLPFFNCENTNNATDGSLFLQGGQMGQGAGGYNMPGLPGNAMTNGWHRLAFAVDLSQNLITKWVDGIKAQDWISGANALDAARRSWQHTAILFADGDGDDHDATIYVDSIQVGVGKRSDAYMQALGGPTGTGIPVFVTLSDVAPTLSIVRNPNGTVTISWPLSATGWGLESTASLNPTSWTLCTVGVVNNSVTLTPGGGAAYFRLHR